MDEEMEKYGVECRGEHEKLQEEMEKQASSGGSASTICPHCGKKIEAKKEAK